MTMKKVEHVHATYDTPHLNAAVGVFALLANLVSVKMILAIRDIEVSANHLADIVDLPVDQTSHELHRLESAGIVSCLLYTSPSPRDQRGSRMPSSA